MSGLDLQTLCAQQVLSRQCVPSRQLLLLEDLAVASCLANKVKAFAPVWTLHNPAPSSLFCEQLVLCLLKIPISGLPKYNQYVQITVYSYVRACKWANSK